MVALRSASFVGRAEQLAVLRELAADASRRMPGVAIVLGEPGIGKTRLVEELIGSLDRVIVARGVCRPGAARDLPLAPVVEVLEDLRHQLGSRFGRLGAANVDPVVATLMRDAAGDRSGLPVRSQAELFDAVVRLLCDVGRSRTLVVAIDDVHWADESSLDLLEFFARSLRDEQVLLVVNARTHDPAFASCDEFIANLAGLRRAVRLTVPRLTAEEVSELVDRLRSSEAVVVRERARLDGASAFRLSEGVPLLVEEVADADLDDIGILADSLLGHRIATLSPAARTVVESAAVAGLEPSSDALARATPLPSDAFDTAFAEATAAGVLLRHRSGDRTTVGFRHSLLREATLARILPNAELELHRRWSAELGQRPEGHVELVAAAYHRQCGDDPSGALTAYYGAALLSRRLSAYAEEKQLLLRAAVLWPLVPDAADRTGTTLSDIYCAAAWCAHLAMDRAQEAKRLADAAVSALPLTATAEERALVTLLWNRTRRADGDGLSTDEVLAAVADVAVEPPSEGAVLAALEAADALEGAGDPAAADTFAGRAVRMAEHLGLTELTARALAARSAVQLARRQDAEALSSADGALRLADQTGDLFARVEALVAVQNVRRMTGQATLVVDEQLIELLGGDRPGPLPGRWGMAQTMHAESLIDTGRWDEAAALLDMVMREPMPDSVAGAARRVADHLAVWRGDSSVRAPDPGRLERNRAVGYVDLDDLLATRYTDSDIVARCGDLYQARAQVAAVIRDDAIAGNAGSLLPMLWVAARVEAEIATSPDRHESAADDCTVKQIRRLVEMAGPHNPRNAAYAAHALADLGRSEGLVRPETWDAVVARWRAVDLPFPLAMALVRAGADQAAASHAHDAQQRLQEAVVIAERLGARPLVAEALAEARRWRLRVRSAASPPTLGLTVREVEVLRLIAEGASNATIADVLTISPKTVSVHVSNILTKLEVPNRASAAAVAHREGLLSRI